MLLLKHRGSENVVPVITNLKKKKKNSHDGNNSAANAHGHEHCFHTLCEILPLTTRGINLRLKVMIQYFMIPLKCFYTIRFD